jgi:LmbE family N-acetylglucosaminyl deacetylase
MLGYPDSGMQGWAQNDASGSFWSTPVEVAAARLAPILLAERPQVVVTYDDNGFYGHPDHIQAHRVTLAALESSGLEASLFYPAFPRSAFQRFREVLREAEVESPVSDEEEDSGPQGVPDDEIGVVIDVSGVVDAKFDALAAHASQTESSFFLKMGRERFSQFFGTEWFVRAIDPRARSGVDHDLFAGWRD